MRGSDLHLLVNGYSQTPSAARDVSPDRALPLGTINDLDWRGGEGVEVGNIRGRWGEVVRAFSNYRAISRSATEDIVLIEEDGLQGIAILQIGQTPIVITEPEDYLPYVVSIIASSDVSPEDAVRKVHEMISIGIGTSPALIERKDPLVSRRRRTRGST